MIFVLILTYISISLPMNVLKSAIHRIIRLVKALTKENANLVAIIIDMTAIYKSFVLKVVQN